MFLFVNTVPGKVIPVSDLLIITIIASCPLVNVFPSLVLQIGDLIWMACFHHRHRLSPHFSVVQEGSKVAVEMTIRCKSFSTQNEPGGVKYFSTKDDTEFNELAWTIGSGELLPGLEEAMMGMRKNALRRIEIPSTQVFPARKANQLPLPTTKDGKRIFERLFKTDATLLFEVLVTRIK